MQSPIYKTQALYARIAILQNRVDEAVFIEDGVRNAYDTGGVLIDALKKEWREINGI